MESWKQPQHFLLLRADELQMAFPQSEVVTVQLTADIQPAASPTKVTLALSFKTLRNGL